MAKSLNRVQIIGNLGQDPEMRTTPQGKSVCTLNIATTESYKDQSGNWQENTDWHRVVLWERLAETAGQYLKKGNKVFIEGKLKTRSYQDQQGVTKYITEVLGQTMIMMGGGPSSGGEGQGGYQRSQAPQQQQESRSYESYQNVASEEFDDEVPF